MSAPRDFVKFSVDLRLQEMRAYIMQAFTPEIVEAALERAFEDAKARFPEYLRNEIDGALRDLARSTAQGAVNRYTIRDEIEKVIGPAVRAALLQAVKKDSGA